MRKTSIFLLLFPIITLAQIGINTTAPKAALDVESSDNGILIPRVQLLDDLDITTILNPNGGVLETSTLVYNIAPAGVAPNTIEAGFYYWTGSKWNAISSNTDKWSLSGNAGTNPATLFGSNFATGESFIGTTDYEHLIFGTNNRPIMKITDFGNVGIGVDNPFAKLHIDNQDSEITSFINKRNLTGGFGGSSYVSPTFIVRTASTAGGTNEVYHNAEFMAFGVNAATNVAGFFSASQAANNYAIIVPENGGSVGIGTSTPTEKLHVFSGLDLDKSSIFGNASQASVAADFLNIGVKGNGNGSGSYGFGVGVLGTTDVNATWNSTGVYAQLGAVNPTFSSFTSSNQALVANGNGLGRSAMFLGGNVGIGLPLTSNPSSLLHINSATNGAVRIVDGTEASGRVLTSDANGVATWRIPGVNAVLGTISTVGANIAYDLNTLVQTGSNITLPPGTYAVQVTMLLARNIVTPSPNNSSFWVRTSFADTNAANPLPSSDIVGSNLISGNFPGTNLYAMLTGTVIINNYSGADKTYYYVAGRCVSFNTSETLNGFASTAWAENTIFALRLN